jgi:hypothetical protein
MKWVLSAFFLAALLKVSGAQAQSIDWPLVARAEVIVIATPVPLDPSASVANADTAKQVAPGYYAMELTEPGYLKGVRIGAWVPDFTPVVLIPEGQPAPPQEPSLFFLTERDFTPRYQERRFDPDLGFERDFPPDTRSWLYVLAEGSVESSVRPYNDSNTAVTLYAMVKNWEAVEEARRHSRSFPSIESFLDEISRAPADPESQKALLRKLQTEVGILAFDYLIYRIEDRRPFPAGSLTFDVEGNDITIRATEMVDAIDAILLHLDGGDWAKGLYGIDRRFLIEEPSWRARENAIRAWQIHFARKSIEFTVH